MGKQKLVFDTREITDYETSLLSAIDKALFATAYHIRDAQRQVFLSSDDMYKHYRPGAYYELANAILVGRLRHNAFGSSLIVHGLGDNIDQHDWKARFFIGGTNERQHQSKGGFTIKKGRIKENEAITKGAQGGENTLHTFVKTAIEK